MQKADALLCRTAEFLPTQKRSEFLGSSMNITSTRGTAAPVRLCTRSLLLAAGLAIALPVVAQSSADSELSEVTVTGSRVARSGFSAPTPTAVISADDVQRSAPIAIAEALTQMPSFRIASSPTTANTFADLRRMGRSARSCLSMEEGISFAIERHVDQRGATAMVERTELVTGGASASWGSDAVSGVVNIILRKDLEGFIGNFQGGISRLADDKSVMGSFAFGHKFGESTHLLVGAEYADSEGVGSAHPPEFARRWGEAGSLGNTSTTNGLPGTIYCARRAAFRLSRRRPHHFHSAHSHEPSLVACAVCSSCPMLHGSVRIWSVFGNRMIGGTDNEGRIHERRRADQVSDQSVYGDDARHPRHQ